MAPQTDEEILELTAKFRTHIIDLELDTWNRSDLVLLNWIKFGGYDLKKAEQGLRNYFKWRQEQNIDKILEEVVALEFEEYIPCGLSGVDKAGWPVVVCQIGAWDLKGLLNKGHKSEQLSRYIIRLNEGLDHVMKTTYLEKLETFREKPVLTHGGVIIFDFGGFNLNHFTSLGCINIMTSFFKIMEYYYPRYGFKHNFVNVTGVLPRLLKVATSSVLASKTLSQMTVLGSDKTEWIKELRQHVDLDQIPDDYYEKH